MKSGEEFVVSICVLLETQNLKVTAGRRHLTIKFPSFPLFILFEKNYTIF
jgi:topoisomerase-4 subunit A